MELKEYNKKEKYHMQKDSMNYRNKILKEIIPDKIYNNAIDLGAGNNSLIYSFNCKKRYILDYATFFQQEHEKKGSIFYRHDLHKGIPKEIKNTKFDLIICTEVLEHLLDGKNLLADIKKIISDEGILLITVPNDIGFFLNRILLFIKGDIFWNNNQDPYEEQHIHFFNKKKIKILFKNLGLKIIYLGGFNESLGRGILEKIANIPFKKYLARKFPDLFATNYIVLIKKDLKKED